MSNEENVIKVEYLQKKKKFNGLRVDAVASNSDT